MNDQEHPSQTEATPQIGFETQFSTFTDQIVNAMQRISVVAEKGPVNLLLTFGTVLILLAIFLKVEIQGVRFSNLTPAEFTALVASATLLLILASLIRLYQYKGWQEITKEQQKVGADLMRQQQQAAAELMEKTSRAAEEMAKPKPDDKPIV